MRDLAAGLLAIALVTLTGIFDHELWTADEPREAEIGREMAANGFPATPTLNQSPFLEKPPFFYWTVGACLKAGGVRAGVARIPSVAFGWITLCFTALLARRLFGPAAALRSCLLLSVTGLFYQATHKCLVDSALVAATTGSFYFLYEAVSRPDRRRPWYLAAYGCAVAAFLAKGLIGPGLVAAGFAAYLLWTRQYREFLRAEPWWAAAGLGAAALAWTSFLSPADRTAFWLTNHLGRFTGAGWSGGHLQPVYYYGYAWTYAFAPWSLFLPLVVARAWKRGGGSGPERFLLAQVAAGVIVLSIASTKREMYLLPLSPAVAILVSGWMDPERAPAGSGAPARAIVLGVLGIVYLALAGAAVHVRHLPGLAGALAIAAGLGALRTTRNWPDLLALGTAAAVAGAVLILVPYADARKNMRPFCEKLPAVDPVPAWRPDEMTLSMIPFYTGRAVQAIETPAQAQAAARRIPAYLVVVPKRHSPGAADELRPWYPFVLRDVELVGDRRLLLLSNSPSD